MDRLAQAWREVEDRYGFPFETSDISARAVMGIALIMALESQHNRHFDRDRAVALISEGTLNGFFPPNEPEQRQPRSRGMKRDRGSGRVVTRAKA